MNEKDVTKRDNCLLTSTYHIINKLEYKTQ